jgi:hypothetical protein
MALPEWDGLLEPIACSHCLEYLDQALRVANHSSNWQLKFFAHEMTPSVAKASLWPCVREEEGDNALPFESNMYRSQVICLLGHKPPPVCKALVGVPIAGEKDPQIVRPNPETCPHQAVREGKRRELTTDHRKKRSIQKGRLVFKRKRLRHNLEKFLRVRGAHLHANEAGVDSEQPFGDAAVLLLERPLAQHQGLRTQSIDDVDTLQSFRETPLKVLCRLVRHASKQYSCKRHGER